jgi:outer membrane protein assembly factor BamD (BamD/ComL family)
MSIPTSFLIAIAGLAILASCGEKGTTPGKATDQDTIAAARVQALEDSLSVRPDQKRAQALIDVYMLYAKVHPLDSLSPEYIFRAANMKVSFGQPQAGITLYDRIIANYPRWRKLQDAYYLKALTIDNDLHQKGAAQHAYQEVIDRFPGGRFSDEAKQMIANMKYTDEELIKKFEAMNADSAKVPATVVK